MQPIKATLVSPRAMPMRIGSPILMRNNVPRRGSKSRHILLSQKAEGGCPSLPFGGVGQSPLACASFMLRRSADGGEGTMTLLATPRSAGRRPGTRYSLELPVRLLGRGRSFVESDACRSLASRPVGLACSTSTRRGGPVSSLSTMMTRFNDAPAGSVQKAAISTTPSSAPIFANTSSSSLAGRSAINQPRRPKFL